MATAPIAVANRLEDVGQHEGAFDATTAAINVVAKAALLDSVDSWTISLTGKRPP